MSIYNFIVLTLYELKWRKVTDTSLVTYWFIWVSKINIARQILSHCLSSAMHSIGQI